MLDKLLKLQTLINGSEAALFKEFYYGKYFSGHITITDGAETGTLFFHRGNLYCIEKGIPKEGIDIGVSGTKSGWALFSSENRTSLTISVTRPDLDNKAESRRLIVSGGAIRVRQNWNPLAQVARLYSSVRGN